MIPIVLVAIGAAGAAASGAIGSRITNKIKSHKEIEAQTILSGDSANYPRILICGASGAGKSTLINSVLEAPIAQVGSGGAVTRGVSEYLTDSKKLRLCECEGYTVGKVDAYRQRVELFFKKYPVDSVWYCINAGANRFLDADEENIKQLIDKVGESSVTVVITQIDATSKQELKDLTDRINTSFPLLEVLNHSTDQTYSEQAKAATERLTKPFAAGH